MGLMTGCSLFHDGEAKTPEDPDSLKTLKYTEAVKTFEDEGFTKVKAEKIEDLITGEAEDGDVAKITVGGKEDYTPDEWIPEDTEVIVYYHTMEVYQPSDDLLIVKFTNNTGKDIGLDIAIDYETEDGTTTSSWSSQDYLPAGEPYIMAEEAEDKIKSYEISYEVKGASSSVKKYYEKTPYELKENEYGGIDYHMTDNTTDGFSDQIYIFYEDKNGKILGYDGGTWSGAGDIDDTFEQPGYDYDKYEFIRTKF